MESDSAIESALRETVRQAFALREDDNLTLRSARSDASRNLSLPDEFFKSNPEWMVKSKEIVFDEAVSSRSCNCQQRPLS